MDLVYIVVSVCTALQSPIEYQRKEGGITVTRPLSSGRPPSAPPTPNGHATQPSTDNEQDDQVGVVHLYSMCPNSLLHFIFKIKVFWWHHVTFDSSGAGYGAARLCGSAGRWDLCVPQREGSDSGIQPAGSVSSLQASQQRLPGRWGLGATQRAQHTLTETHTNTY